MFDEYRFSGSLPENASTYVTREADKELYESLTAGKFCYVLNSRQSGKSSIRVRTMRRLRDAGVECAAIDLSAGGVQNVTPEQWYVDLIDNLIETFALDVDLAEWWVKNKLHSEVTRFRKFIEEVLLVEVKENIVIFIDEIDSVLSLNFPTDDFFALIRACHNQRVDNSDYNRLTFCLLGVASPSNLIQDKQRTPFNIGRAINLKGFQLHEVEPLRKGLEGKFPDSQVVMQEILNWTGGQPFLTQKLCQFMVEESEKENPRTVESVVKSRIIESWESQDEPEHLRTIRSRILRDEERAGYLLDLYQQIHSHGDVVNNDSAEQSELLLSGLVDKQQEKLILFNRIYQEVFNQNWVEAELKKLRPYSEAFRAWVASGCVDESRLLRGNALKDAEEWGKNKNLSYQDKQFLAASREKEIQEEIAAREIEAQLERERKDREATEERNLLLTEANKKAKRQIRNGSAVLLLALLVAAILGVFAATEGNKALKAQERFQEANTKAIEANKKVEYANRKAEEEGKKVIAFKQQTQQLQTIANAAKQQAQQATEKAKEEKRKAEQAQINANDANQKATAAIKQAQNAERNADAANQKAIVAKKQAGVEQQKAEESQKIADDANRKAQVAKKQAQVEQRKAEESQKIADDANRQAQAAKKQADSLETQLALGKKDVENVQKLSQLAGELRNNNLISESDEALKQAGLSFRVNDHNLKQALLLASMSQAYQQLKKPDDARINITESLNYLQDKGNNINSEQKLQIQVLVKNTEVNLLYKEDKTKAIEAYQQAYNIIKLYPNETNPFKNNQIINAQNIESVHRGLLNLLTNKNQDNFRQEVRKSLKQHFFAELESFLKGKQWQEAEEKTWNMMLFIANREEEFYLDYPQIENFSCPALKQIDDYWVQNSKGNFGFSVQKKIWVSTGNRLGIKLEDWNDNDEKNYLRFASAVGWLEGVERQPIWYLGDLEWERIKKDPTSPRVRGGIPVVFRRDRVTVGPSLSFLALRLINCNI
ncbi:AAA-like domain-containing protein [Tolypothrix sp. VBCCA 56010]|uniref:AAA-like domain-containing protein n=1 Tax=Tolypothrix sp. VBCCA 56010 TaxID=3137731 RepID=UPI003D7CFD4F